MPGCSVPATIEPSSVVEIAAARCFHTSELIDLLSPDTTPLSISEHPPSEAPPSGSVFLFDRRVTRNYKRDHHDWIKKPVSSKKRTSRVREDDVRLRYGGQVRVAGYYARSAAGGRTMRRRAYCLVDPVSLKPESDLVLVHYLDLEETPTPTSTSTANRTKGGYIYRSRAIDSPSNGKGSDTSADRKQSSTEIVSDESSVDGGEDSKQKQHISECNVDGNESQSRTTTNQGIDNTACHTQAIEAKSLGGDKIAPPADVVSNVGVKAISDSNSEMLCDTGGRKGEEEVGVFERVSSLVSSSPISKMLRNLSQFQNAPKLVEDEFLKEWEICTEKEKSDAIADIYGSALAKESTSTDQLNSDCTRNEFIHELQSEMQSKNLSLMDDENEKLSVNEKLCYLEAQQRCPHLVSKIDFKLQVLRCKSFDQTAAAHLCANYWTKRVEHFGHDLAFLPMTLEGAMTGDCEEPEFQHARLLPGTDASGRGIIFLDNTIQGTHITMLRSIWYAAHAALEMESVRRNGLVFIVFKSAPPVKMDRQFIAECLCLMKETFPLQLRATHVCHFDQDGWYMPMVHGVIRYMAGKFLRSRLVFHEGSTEQVLLQLAEYGILRDQLPSRIGGLVSDEDFNLWLARRREEGN